MPVAQAEVLAQVRQHSPVLAVVVEQINLGTPHKPLFDLLLKIDDQWLQARTEQNFKPGTVLMIEASQGNQLLVLTRPDSQQLQQMMQASLSFWQAHTLPRVHPTELPPLPAPPALNAIAQQHPNLAPLVQWLTQAGSADSANLMRWVANFLPLNTERPAITPLQAGSQTGSAPPPAQTSANPSGAAVGTASTAAPTVPPASPLLPSNQSLTQAIVQVNSSTGPSSALQPVTTPTQNPAPLPLQVNALMASQNATPAPALPASAQMALNAALAGTRTPLAESDRQGVSPASLTATQGQPQPPANSGATVPVWRELTSPASASTGARDATPVPMEIRLGQWLAQIESNVRQHPATLQEALAIKARQLLNANDAARPVQPGSSTPTPPSAVSARAETLEPLLQLRGFLEGVQAKMQNNAIQQSLSTLTQPDMPQVQQLSIPLIWLGVAAWANLEWWQEKRQRKDEDEKRSSDRLWRLRLFLELKPLAPLCADLTWQDHETQVIFWSQDPGTLTMVNQHLDQLTAWTEGLGDRQFTTRHGMPPKKTTPKADDFQPLVDVRT